MQGTIKKVTEKGFGFIAGANGQEYFFHQSSCVGTRFDDLRPGQAVTFDEGQGPKGPRAEKITASWASMPDRDRDAKYYRLTAAGKKQLANEHSKWQRLARAIGRVMVEPSR